ncbi:MAG: hypothetical protein ACP5GC_04810, partial [Thiomonas sp.]
SHALNGGARHAGMAPLALCATCSGAGRAVSRNALGQGEQSGGQVQELNTAFFKHDTRRQPGVVLEVPALPSARLLGD